MNICSAVQNFKITNRLPGIFLKYFIFTQPRSEGGIWFVGDPRVKPYNPNAEAAQVFVEGKADGCRHAQL